MEHQHAQETKLARAVAGAHRAAVATRQAERAISRARAVRVRRIRWTSEDPRRPWVSAQVEVDEEAFDHVAFSRDELGRPCLAEPQPVSGQPPLRFEGEVRAVLLRIADLLLPPLRPLRPVGNSGRYATDPRPRCSLESLLQARRASFGAMYCWEAAESLGVG